MLFMVNADVGRERTRRSSTDELASLARAAIEGNAAATRTLIVSVTPSVLRTVRGVLGNHHPEVEDAAQETALRLVHALPTFRFECTVLHFACRIAALTALNIRRAGQVRGEGRSEMLDPERHVSAGDSPAEELEAAARREALRELFLALPTPQAEALILHLVMGFTIEETADACEVPPNTVRSRLRLAKQAVRMRASSQPALLSALEGGE